MPPVPIYKMPLEGPQKEVGQESLCRKQVLRNWAGLSTEKKDMDFFF